MSLSGKSPLTQAGAIAFFLLHFLGYTGQMSNLYAKTSGKPPTRQIKRVGIEEFQIQMRSKDRPLDSNTGRKVASLFYKEFSSYHQFDLIPPSEMPVKIELVKTPESLFISPSAIDQIKEPQTDLNGEKSRALIKKQTEKDINKIGTVSPVIDLDNLLAGVIERYKNTDLDAVVTGVITDSFNYREGSSMAIKNPPASAFIVYLVGLEDKQILWSGHFAETQVALLDNLLLVDRFVEAGGVWLTSDALSKLVMKRSGKVLQGLIQ